MSASRRSFSLGGGSLLLAVGVAASLAAGPRPSSSASPVASPSPKAGQAAPVYTEEDLKKAGGHVNKLEASPGTSASSASEARSETVAAREGRKGQEGQEGQESRTPEQGWRERFAAKRQEIADAEAKVKELEANVTALNLDAAPNPTDLMDPNRLQKREAAVRAAMADLEKTRQQIVALRQDLSDLEDEARRASVPPGWTRE